MFSCESAPEYNDDKTLEELDRLPPGYYTDPMIMKRSESPPPGEHIPGEPQTPNMTNSVSEQLCILYKDLLELLLHCIL